MKCCRFYATPCGNCVRQPRRAAQHIPSIAAASNCIQVLILYPIAIVAFRHRHSDAAVAIREGELVANTMLRGPDV